MVVGDSPADWPPPGYTEDVKVSNGRKIKFYTHVETGKKFYSKKEVSRYMNSKDICNGVKQVNCQNNSFSENKVSQINDQDKSCSENDISQVNYQDKSCSENNVSQINYQDKSCSENNDSQIFEGTKKSHEWLPPGWIVELKTRKSGSLAGSAYKVYIDPSSGNKFYSKPEVSKYLKTMKQSNITGEHGAAEVSSSNQKASENSKDIGGQSRISKRQKSDTNQTSVKTISYNGIKEGSLPKQITSQDSEEFVEPSCISKRQKSGSNRASSKTSLAHGAVEDLSNEKASHRSKENGAHCPLSKRKRRGPDSPSAKTVCSVEVDCDSADELPPGWKKEVVIRKSECGIRKDPLYTDPVHGYVFRSKREVSRYLKTGDTSRCARRSSTRNAASTMEDNSPTTEDASLKKLECFVRGRQLFAAEESKGGKSFFTGSPAQVESCKKQPGCSVSDPNTIITSILAEINEDHSCENINEDSEIGLARATESVDVKRLLPVSTARSDLLPEKKHLPEKELEKQSHISVMEQSLKSRSIKSPRPGCRVSKRLAGHSPEVAVDLDQGERAIPPVVEKSAPLSIPPKAIEQELLQQSVPTLETGKCAQASLSGASSSDDLPPGWKKEYKITKTARGIRKDPLYIDPVDGYIFRSKKDVLRYLQSGDISKCAIRPTKRDLDTTMKESSPTTLDTSSKNLGCSDTKRQPFAAEESRGGKRSVAYSLAVQTESSTRQPESSASNPSTNITPFAADINAKHSYEDVTENTEKSVDTEPERRRSSRDTKVLVAESGDVKRVSAVSAPKSDVRPKQQLLENEQEKHINKGMVEQSKRSKNKKLLTPGHRTSKRLVGQNPEPVADLDLGERAFRAVVKKSASLGLPLNVCGQEILAQNKDPTVRTGNSDHASLSRDASVDEISPGCEKEILAQNKDPIVGTGNCEQASLSREPSVDELPPSREKEVLAQNKDPTVGTGNSDQASLSGEASVDELPPSREKEVLAQNKDSTVGTGNSDKASQSREASVYELPPSREKEVLAEHQDPTVGNGSSDQATLTRDTSVDKISPGWGKEILAQNKDPIVGTGISDQASLSREASEDELPPGWTKEMLVQNKDPIGSGNSYQVSTGREFSVDELPPGWTKEMLPWNKDPIVGIGNSDQVCLSREASVDELPPGWTKEMLARNKDPAVKTCKSDQAFLIREASVDELPPGWTMEMVAQNKVSAVKTCKSDEAFLSREAPLDDLPPGWTKEMLARNKDPTAGTCYYDQASVDELPPGWTKEMLARKRDPTVGTCYSNQASLIREISEDELPPGWTLEMLAQNKNPTVGTGSSYQASLSREASVDDLPPGWKKEMRIRKNSRGTKRDPFYTDPVHGYVFRSKKDVMRYLQTGDISKCAVRPTKRDPDLATEDNFPSTHDANSNLLGCSPTGRQFFGTEETKGGMCSVAYSLDLQADGSMKRPESSVFNSKTSVSSIVADITERRSCENVNEDAEVRLHMEPEIKDSAGDRKAIAAESFDVQQLPENEKAKHSNKGALAQSRNFRNKKSLAPVRRVSKRLSHHSLDLVADLDLGECALRGFKKSALSGLPLNVSGQELPQQTDLATGNFDPASLSNKAPSPEDPMVGFVKCPSEEHTFKEQKAAKELPSEKQYGKKRILQDSQPVEISYGSGNVQLMRQEVKEGPTKKLVKVEQDNQKKLLKNVQPAELAWESGKLPMEYQSTLERLTAVQVSEKQGHEKMQWQDSQLAEPSQRSGQLNAADQSIGEKQTGVPVNENPDDQSRRLQAQLGSYPIGDYWSDPCLEFAFKTLTGAIPVEDTLGFQGSSQQEFGTAYTQAYDGCFDLPVFNTSNFYMNDVPNHCAPTEEHVAKYQPPINLNEPFLPSGDIGIPGCSSFGSQNPGSGTQDKDYQSKVTSQSWNRSS